MLVTAASNATLALSTTRTASRADATRNDEVRVTTPTPTPIPSLVRQSESGSETLNLSAQIREQMEQDLDYQILRRAFALDVDDSKALRQGQAAKAAPGDQRDASSLQSTSLAESFEIQAVATQRLEISVRAGEAAFMTAMAGANAQRLELNIGAAEGVQIQTADPLVLDLGGQGITTTGVAAGVDFDLNGDGRLERMSTVTGDSWFLALDWNANGRIDDGRELFGDQNGAEHGFAELARHDTNGDARIDAQDAIFEHLRLVQFGADGSQTSRTLDEAGVSAIELGHRNVHRAIDAYDHVAQTGHFVHADGRRGEAADVMLGYHDLA
ncbi:MAG: hypothetical protein MZV65_24895 [Chromatiales bacterium]|nr:hypothetical protein [Chromatiales bacterium]